jgi:membrane-bound metal-dependent hydrolase YbcI (DUF457 family)
MKGITHWLAGVAVASCVPHAVRAAADGNPLYFVLGAVAGLLPDTLDFKLIRFLARHDVEIIPDPACPDARLIARGIAQAIGHASATGKPVRLKLAAILTGGSTWQPYEVTFDPARPAVRVRYLTEEGGRREPETGVREEAAAVVLPCPVAFDYVATFDVQMFDGPLLRLEPDAKGRVLVRFLPWHRQWTHSVPVTLALGLGAGAAWGFWAGLVTALAALSHVLLDQLGFMGSNLWAPFSRRRTPGLQWWESMNIMANFGTVWTFAVLIAWNLSRLTPGPGIPRLPFVPLLVYAALLPLGAVALLRRWLRRRP